MKKIYKQKYALKTRALSYKMLKVFVFISLWVVSHFSGFAQSVQINADNQPLSEILIQLRDTYEIQISFNHQLIANCLVTEHSKFSSAEMAVAALTAHCNLNYENSGGVFVVYEKSNKSVSTENITKHYFYSGQLYDALNTEPLPYSSIQINQIDLIADASGNFSFKTSNPIEKFKVSHVGYFLLDTALNTGNNHKIALMPSIIGLSEVIVNSDAKVFSAFIGEKTGLIKLNHKIASFLPGNNNNTLFNLLRLQPGIVATAEQNSDYIIWGSYKGQNLLQFDGIMLFSANSLNNEIGIVNPLIVKDVEVFKGGYNVDKGDRVGGIVNITGNFGNPDEFSANVNLNSQTLSGMLNIPIANNYAVQAAFRQSYYSVFDWNLNTTDNENSFLPEYNFQDLNVKFSGRRSNGDNFYISLLGNNDNSAFDVLEEGRVRDRAWESSTEKHLIGGSAYYNKNWKNFGSSIVTAAYSSLNTNSFDQRNIERGMRPTANQAILLYGHNGIVESTVKIEHLLHMLGIHKLALGTGIINNTTFFSSDSLAITQNHNYASSFRFNGFIKDNISIGDYFSIEPGLRMDFFPEWDNYYFQPRVNAIIKLHPKWKINMAWGIYNQYITEMKLIDDLGNNSYFWGLSDNSVYPLLTGEHKVLGLSYNAYGLKFGTEGFYKTTEGLSRFGFDRNNVGLIIINGKSRAYGIDFYAQKDIHKHNFWVSYTLSKAEENFSKISETYTLASQNQTHEVKGAAIVNLEPWYFSINYVYGSGLALSKGLKFEDIVPYNRIDIALLYKFKTTKFNLSSGLSVVNLFNTKNVAYTGFSKLPGGRVVYSQGMPFTPTLFFNIGF